MFSKSIIKENRTVRLSLISLALIFICSIQGISQSCDYQTGIIEFNAQGENTTDLYTTTYVLTDINGEILALSSATRFTIDVQGFYVIYGVNYKNDENIEGLSVGSNIHVVSGGCVDISQPFTLTVCEALDPCNYCLGEMVVLDTEGGNNDPSFTTRYILTDRDGVILRIQNNADFGMMLESGLFVAFAINYDSNGTILGLEEGQNIADISSTCHEISDGYIVGVCQALDPTIFFDLKGCDITNTAILQVGEVYDSYEWSTGSTASFIEIDANTPATYTVTVALASGCIGVVSQTITGNEVATIGNYVWEDLDGDGIQDENEPGINGVTVNLYTDFNSDGRPDIDGFPSCIFTTSNNPQTGQPGYYNFNVYAASYIVEFIGPNGFAIATRGQGDDRSLDSDVNPNTGLTSTIRVEAGDRIDDIDAGFFTSSGFGGIVWNDTHGNGVFDEGESGLNEVTINLYDEDGMLVSTTISATTQDTVLGFYCFDELVPAAFYAEIVLPDGNVLSPPNRRTDDDIDSDADGSNGPFTTPVYDLLPGEKVDNVDFGTYVGGRICGIVWQESSEQENSTYDEGVDELVPNTQLELISIDANNTVVATATTNGDGSYCFEEVPMGSYRVRPRASDVSGSYVDQGQGGDPLLDSDINPNTVSTDVFFLDPSEELLGVNAGLRSGTVPIELIGFTAEWNRSLDQVELNWQTATEINNEKFIIERVIGNSEKFEAIGEVTGNGTTTEVINYDYVDQDVAISAVYYYRLKQVDYDGGFEYSDIVAVDIERNQSISLDLYPNPASSFVTIAMELDQGALYRADLIDVSGQLIRSWNETSIFKGNSSLTLDITDVPMGHYMLSLQLGTQTYNKILLVTK